MPPEADILFVATAAAAEAIAPELPWSSFGVDGSGEPLSAVMRRAVGEGDFLESLELLTALSIWEHSHFELAPLQALYRPDPPHPEGPDAGPFELWSSPVALRTLGEGDCEDFAAELVGQWIAAGFPARTNLSCVDPGGPHDMPRYHVTAITPAGEIDLARIHWESELAT